MKLKPSLGASYIIQPGNSGSILLLQGPHRASAGEAGNDSGSLNVDTAQTADYDQNMNFL